MIKYLRYHYLHKIVKDPVLAAKIYEMIYHKVKFDATPPVLQTNINIEQIKNVDEINSVTTKSVDTKMLQRGELEKTLLYLKAKPVKTKQEKDSIGIIEAVLKNER